MNAEKIKRRPTSEERLEMFRDIFPEAFADGRVALDRLKELFEDGLSDTPAGEHYGLNWPGKLEARRRAYQPPRATLRPLQNSGVDEANTHNAVVIGDNLQILLTLRKSYANAVKLVYIDPPYNTGRDLIYKDDFSDPVEAYLEATQQADVGGLLVSN